MNDAGAHKPVQVRLKPELHQWVRQEAERLERSANWVINKLIEQAAHPTGEGAAAPAAQQQ